METSLPFYAKVEHQVLKQMERLPVIGFYAKSRGWNFVLAWAHRAAGILLVLYLWFHIYTLTSLTRPDSFNATMKFFQYFVFVFLEWALAIPVIFHTLNGGRLILYEVFYSQADAAITRGALIFSFLFVALMALMIILGNQMVSPFLFWLCLMILGISTTYLTVLRVWSCKNSAGWKLQRITGALLLPMIPAHFLFMHLDPSIGHVAENIIARMQFAGIKFVNLLLLAAALYHGGYGLLSIIKDYLPSRILRFSGAVLVVIVMGLFFIISAKLTVLI